MKKREKDDNDIRVVVRVLDALDKYIILSGSIVVVVISIQEKCIMTVNFFFLFVFGEATLF